MSAGEDVFDDPTIEIFDEMTADDIEDWDSLTHINLVVAVEKDFQVSLTTREVMSVKNVGDFTQLLHQKLSA